MATDGHRGTAALAVSDYPTAIQHFTKALKDSQSPVWLIQRSTAYQRSNQHELALADADNAVIAATARAKRELIASAQLRRAVALHGLKRFGDARMCLNWSSKMNDKEKGITLWMSLVKSGYDKAGGDEAECNKVTVKQIPDPVKEGTVEENKPAGTKNNSVLNERILGSSPAAPVALTPTVKEKIRKPEWYQSTSSVTIDIMAKGVPKEQASIEIQAGSLEVSFPIVGSDSHYHYELDPLFSEVDASKSSFRITPHKIEITLHKTKPGLKWSSLEGTEPINTTTSEPAAKIPGEVLKPGPVQVKGPVYPTSSKKGPVNWDALPVEDEEEDEGPDAFFKKLYKGADPDTQRAMMKSYQESNGTSLSTSWSDVGSKSFETQPPEGMEAKKW